MNKPDERESLPNRARRYVQGIVVAATLTLVALVYMYATFHSDRQTEAATQPPPPHAATQAAPVTETGSITKVRAPN